MLRTGPKTVVVTLQYHASTDTSQFWVVWWGYVFKITVSPCYPYTASGADCSGSVVWAVGSNKSPWWLCPSLGILCSDWESGVSVARSWGRDAWPAARGQGSQGLISKHGFLTRARLQCSQLVQSLSSSHTRRRRAKTWTEYTEFQSHTYGENMCMHMKKWTEGSSAIFPTQDLSASYLSHYLGMTEWFGEHLYHLHADTVPCGKFSIPFLKGFHNHASHIR